MSSNKTTPPDVESLYQAAGDDPEAQAEIDALHAELNAEKPSTHEIRKYVTALYRWPELGSIVANWWDDPRTQQFIEELTGAGL